MGKRGVQLVLIVALLAPLGGCLAVTATKAVVGTTRLAVRTTAKATVATVKTTGKVVKLGARVVSAPFRHRADPAADAIAPTTKVNGEVSPDAATPTATAGSTTVGVASSGMLAE